MISNSVIQNSIDELRTITRVDLTLFDPDGKLVVTTLKQEEGEITPEKIGLTTEIIYSFANSPAESQVIGGMHLLKISEGDDLLYILVSSGSGEDAYMVARIACSQLNALILAYKDRYDRNSFYQNLLLDNMLSVDVINQARKLKIEGNVPRAVLLVETKQEGDGLAAELLKGLYSEGTSDAVTSVDENMIVLVKTLEDGVDTASLQEIAETIVSVLNTEAMATVRVAYGTVVNELKDVSKSYKEAKMAMEVGKIFYAERNTLAYSSLGIGRLIYQLPVNLCEIFIQEIFRDGIPEELDDETMNILNKFFENNMNVSETSKQQFIHRNTLVYRIEKVKKATGLDLRNFSDALTFKIAMMVEDYLNYMANRDENY